MMYILTAPKQKEKPFVDDDGDLSSVSDAGSIDSIDSDDEGPKNEDILFGNVSLRGIGEHRSMHDAMAELRDHFGDAYDEEEEEGECGSGWRGECVCGVERGGSVCGVEGSVCVEWNGEGSVCVCGVEGKALFYFPHYNN